MGCTSNSISNESNTNKNALFENREKCLEHQQDVQDEVKKFNEVGIGWIYGLEQIFYSSKTQKCYVIYNLADSIPNDPTQPQFRYLHEYWNHYTNSESIMTCRYINWNTSDWCEEFMQYIKELKWE